MSSFGKGEHDVAAYISIKPSFSAAGPSFIETSAAPKIRSVAYAVTPADAHGITQVAIITLHVVATQRTIAVSVNGTSWSQPSGAAPRIEVGIRITRNPVPTRRINWNRISFQQWICHVYCFDWHFFVSTQLFCGADIPIYIA